MFEVIYRFHEKTDGVYDRDNVKEMTKRVGKQFEEVPLETLATTIISQLARRDVLIVDVEVYEYSRRKVSFKETKGGVLIRNKKFMLDGTVTEETEETEVVEEKKARPVALPPSRYEIFDPDPGIAGLIQRKGWKLTPKKRYPILAEEATTQRVNVQGVETSLPGIDYVVTDDVGGKVRLSSMHFVTESHGLIGMENLNVEPTPQLTFMGKPGPDMPVLRRGT